MGRLTTPLGEDVLVLSTLNATKSLSELFDFRRGGQLETRYRFQLGARPALHCRTTSRRRNLSLFQRRLHGGPLDRRAEDLYLYQIVLRPWLWLLTPHLGLPHLRPDDADRHHQAGVLRSRLLRLSRRDAPCRTPTLEYCVQYRETDFNFVCRLMEQYGIYYFFEHEDGKHTLVLADAQGEPQARRRACARALHPDRRTAAGERSQYLETWSRGRRAQSGVFVLKDYDYNKPDREAARASGQARRLRPRLHGNVRLSRRLRRHEGNNSATSVGETGEIRLEAAQSLDQRRAVDGRGAVARFPARSSRSRTHPDGGREPGISRHPLHARSSTVRLSSAPAAAAQRRLCRQLRIDAERPPVPRAARHPQARDRRRPVRAGGQEQGRRPGDRRRQTRPDPRPVLLGPRRRSRRAGCASRRSGRAATAARCSRRASATRCWSRTRKATRTGRSSSARSTTGPTPCR